MYFFFVCFFIYVLFQLLKQFTHNLLGNLPTEILTKKHGGERITINFLLYIKTTKIICSNCNSVSESTKIYCIFFCSFLFLFFKQTLPSNVGKKSLFKGRKKNVCVINQCVINAKKKLNSFEVGG